ncbi:MAG: methyl-accepting chemotaxis protein, partial [Geobacter sp.]|nr:methyl-accepting chemotaxis protein [Geobacter sp.]
MRWFYDLKLGKKLMTGFVLVAVIAGIIGGIGIVDIKKLDAEDTKLYEKITVPISQLQTVSVAFQRMRINVRDLVEATTPAEEKQFIENIKELRGTIDKEAAAFEKTILTDEGRKLFAEFVEARKVYGASLDKVIDLAMANNDKAATVIMHGEMKKAAMAEQEAIEKLVEAKIQQAKLTSTSNSAMAKSAFITVGILLILGVLLAVGLGIFITRIVQGQLGADPAEVKEIAGRVAAGDISMEIDLTGKKPDSLLVAMHKMVTAINALVTDANMLSKAAIDGKLDTRADASRHQGEFQKIVSGVNETLDAVIDPLNVAAEYVDKISKGDIPPKITDNYNGDFNAIKNNLNNCIDIMNNLLAEANQVIKAAADGDLDKRANAELFVGGWKQLVVGVNEIVTNIVNPLMVTADYVEKVAKGVIPPTITAEYRGQYNVIKNNLNAMVKMMNELLAETDVIIRAAADGELDKRANAELFVGGWNRLVAGVNDTITNIVNPLMVTADYVDRISKGQMPALITAEYKGQYNLIKQNLNTLIEATNKITSAAREVAGGNLMVELKERSPEDELMHALSDMVGKLVSVVSEVKFAADNVSQGSNEM